MNQYAENVEKNNGYLYILRRTVPPWRWRENLDELVRLCPKYGIDEVCIKIDTGTFTHYYPSFEWLENYRKILLQIKKELNEVGVNYSLNPNVTQGHGDRGRNICKQHPDWPMCTNPDGTHAMDCACNIGGGWRDYIRKQWTIYAETRPVSIWMEDDLRTFNHGPAGIGCFCQEHIRRFNEKLGTHYTREELAEKIFAPGVPDPLRVQWLEFLNEMTLEVMRMCEETVHQVSPETVFGLMSSGPDAHVAEGRDWQAMYRVMSADGKYPVLSRPPLGNYSEAGLPGLCGTSTQILMTRSVFGNACIEEGEIENFPYTGYSKTNTFLCLQNSVAIGCGNDAVTLNLYDHCGTPMSATEDILQALSCGKEYLNTLKSIIQPRGKDRGVRVYFHPDSGKSKQLDARTHNFFGDVGATLEMLKMLGIAATINEDAVTVLAGQSIRSAPDDEILRILKQGAFIDSVAFQALCEMGYAELTGADYVDSFPLNTTYPVSGERFYNEKFGGTPLHAFSLAIHGQRPLFTVMKPHRGSEEITEFVDPDFKRLFPGTCAFTNKLGGRIVVFPLEIAGLCAGFKTPARKKWMHDLLSWIARDTLPMYVTGDRNLLPFRLDRENDTVAGIYNLSLDELENITSTLHVSRKVKSIHVLEYKAAEWTVFRDFAQYGNTLVLRIRNLAFNTPKYFSIAYEKEQK